MAGRQAPTSFTAGRDLTLEGVAYDKGDAIPNDVVAGLRNASALLSRRWIVPNREIHNLRRFTGRLGVPRATTLNAAERRSLLS